MIYFVLKSYSLGMFQLMMIMLWGQDTAISRLQPGIIPNYKSHGERAWGHNIIITSS